jgi:hypothetical protein
MSNFINLEKLSHSLIESSNYVLIHLFLFLQYLKWFLAIDFVFEKENPTSMIINE